MPFNQKYHVIWVRRKRLDGWFLGYRIADLVGFKAIYELQQSTWQEWTPLDQK
jgi:hypothetical protein